MHPIELYSTFDFSEIHKFFSRFPSFISLSFGSSICLINVDSAGIAPCSWIILFGFHFFSFFLNKFSLIDGRIYSGCR